VAYCRTGDSGRESQRLVRVNVSPVVLRPVATSAVSGRRSDGGTPEAAERAASGQDTAGHPADHHPVDASMAIGGRLTLGCIGLAGGLGHGRTTERAQEQGSGKKADGARHGGEVT